MRFSNTAIKQTRCTMRSARITVYPLTEAYIRTHIISVRCADIMEKFMK